jgi:hypothetical protein
MRSEPERARFAAQLERLVRELIRRDVAWREPGAAGDGVQTMTAPAFRAVVAQRLQALERDVAEVRSRVNGLLFVVAGAVVTQVVMGLVA